MTYWLNQRLDLFKKQGLGLKRDNIVNLVPHNRRWKRVFSDEAYQILHTLNIDSLKLYHCGSTSIPGIVAKPIIDIVGSISSLTELDRLQDKLKAIGYEYKGEYGIEGRRYCVLYSPDKKIGFCHLHIFEEGSLELSDHLKFRDYLRLDTSASIKYEKCKLSLKVPRSQYSIEKGSTIKSLMSSAKPYYSPRVAAKILIILGAADGGENTLNYCKEIYKNTDFEVLELKDFEIDNYCYNRKEDDDDFLFLIKKMIEADRVVFASPVYWYSMTTLMKKFVDRFSGLLSGDNKELGESLYGKKIDLVSTGSDLEIPNGFQVPFNLTATYFGMDFMNTYYKTMRNDNE